MEKEIILESSVKKNCNKHITKLKFTKKIIDKMTGNVGKMGKLIWYYTNNGKTILDKIEIKNIVSLSFVDVSTKEHEFDEKTGIYSCPWFFDKVNVNFNPKDVGMTTINKCDYMGFENCIYFVKCNSCDNFYGNGELTQDTSLDLNIDFDDKIHDFNKLKIHFDYVCS